MYFSKTSRILLVICSNLTIIVALPQDRIVGGTSAQPGQFPYAVSIQQSLAITHGHIGGGTIISNQWILTSAHNLWQSQPGEIYINAGTTKPNVEGTRYNVSKIIPHPDHNSSIYLWHDIALIKIDTEFEFNDLVAATTFNSVEANQSSILIGWEGGVDTNGSQEMQFAEVTILSVDDCKTLAQDSVIGHRMKIGDGQVCAYGNGGVGACYGADSGSPLVVDGVVVGLVSYTFDDDCEHKFPDVFTRVNYYREWIQETITNGT